MSHCDFKIKSTCTNSRAGVAFNTRPSLGVCRICEHYEGPPRGAGDIIHAVTTTTGIARAADWMTGGKCGGCAARRAALNAAMPFTDEKDKG